MEAKTKLCCVPECQSSSQRVEDRGVTFHKFPKLQELRQHWCEAARCCPDAFNKQYVCSRHFYKADFEIYKGSKYVLRAGSIPSIFSWNLKDIVRRMDLAGNLVSQNISSNANEVSQNDVSQIDNNISPNNTPQNEMPDEINETNKVAQDVTSIRCTIERDHEDSVPEEISNDHSIIPTTSQCSNGGSNTLMQNDDVKLKETQNNEDFEAELETKSEEIRGVVLETAAEIETAKTDNTESKISQLHELKEDIDKDEESINPIVYSIDSNQQSFTIIRSMIHSSDVIDFNDSLSDVANSSSEGFSFSERSRNECLTSSPIKQEEGDSKFTVGSRVEAKDFTDKWYPAFIVEVDSDEMEVLLRYDSFLQKNDEWISVSSPRLRTFTGVNSATDASPARKKPLKLKLKTEEKDGSNQVQVEYKVGERCLARWSDNRRFPATVRSILGNGKYEIIFDDGICRVCQWYYLSKMKKKHKTSATVLDSSLRAPSSSNDQVSGQASVAPVPYHRHLFDPRLDYLGPKSERRALKKKLDVKALFNIGKRNTPRILKRKTASSNGGPQAKKKSVADMVIKSEPEEETVKATPTLVKQEVKDEDVLNAETTILIKSEDDIKTDDVPLEKCKETPIKKRKSAGKKMKTKSNITLEKPVLTDTEPFIGFDINEAEADKSHMNVVESEKIPDQEIAAKLEEKIEPQVDNALEMTHEVKDESVDIDEGLKLIAQAVTSFDCDMEKTEFELDVNKSEIITSPVQSEILQPAEGMVSRYEASLREGEWCCKWVDGEPQGEIVESDTEAPIKGDTPTLPRKSVWVEDKRLPLGWKKILVRRCYGNSAGKWDVVLVDPNNRRLRDKGEMRNYLITSGEHLRAHEHILMDFSVHRKLARQMGWDITTAGGARLALPASPPRVLPLKIKLPKKFGVEGARKKKKRPAPLTPHVGVSTVDVAMATPSPLPSVSTPLSAPALPSHPAHPLTVFTSTPTVPTLDGLTINDGYVYVGSMKVQIIENLFRCPAEGCYKNFRKDNLLRMHIKHYHREMRKLLGATPKVSDLAYARTVIPENTIVPKARHEGEAKIPKPKAVPKTPTDKKDSISGESTGMSPMSPATPIKSENESTLNLQDSPKLRNALENAASVKRPKILYPVKKEVKEELSPRPEELTVQEKYKDEMNAFVKLHKLPESDHKTRPPEMEGLDFEAAISTHTVTKPLFWKKKKRSPKKVKPEGQATVKKKKKKPTKWLEFDDWEPADSPQQETDAPQVTSEAEATEATAVQEAPKQDTQFMISETGEKIKIVHMKREEIINCHCGFGEEDGLMIQCDLCLCWQHAICHNYDTNTVPDKYTCSICLSPRRGRASRRHWHDQGWLYEGALPGAAPCPALRRAHELTGNLLRLAHALTTLRLKLHVATKKNHPKLYLWAKDWDASDEFADRAEPPHPADLGEMLRDIGKENLPLKDSDDKSLSMESDGQREEGPMGSQALLSLLSGTGGALELPISTSELERLAKSVQEAETLRSGPEPEAAIESSVCRKNLLTHIQRLQTLIDNKLDSIEAQVAELESQEQSFEDDETVDYFPRTKQTIQMLYRDLDTLEEIGIIT